MTLTMLIALLFVLLSPSQTATQTPSPRDLLDRFKQEKVFWRQFEIGQALAGANDRSVIPELESWLMHNDRHLRGNVAFVLGRLGDPRGFETIAAILEDRASRSEGQGIPGGASRRRFAPIATMRRICLET